MITEISTELNKDTETVEAEVILPIPLSEQFCIPNSSVYQNFILSLDRKDKTADTYKSHLKNFSLFLYDRGISSPSANDLREYRDYVNGKGLKPSTVRAYLRSLKQFFEWTEKEGIYEDIASDIRLPRVDAELHKKDALSKEDVQAIAGGIDRSTEQGKRLYAMFLLAVTCGLRTIEIKRANIEDIKEIRGRYFLYIQGKGHDEKDAPVEIIPEVMDAWKDYMSVRTVNYDKFCEDRAEKNPESPAKRPLSQKSPLFASTSNRSMGERMAETTISKTFKKMLVDAGYNSDRLTAHSLRHTSGTAVYNATHNLFSAQMHQRHSDPSTTEIYLHAEEREERHTEQQAFDYLFDREDSEAELNELISAFRQLSSDKKHTALTFIKGLL